MEPMDGERWRRIREVFEAALETPAEERASFLDQACAEDDALRREVESLLAADASDDTLLKELAEPEGDPMVGRRIGPYRVERRLGSGGMGVVYLAVRVDEEFRRRVALKILRPGLGHDDLVRRFRAERQILAALDHPNIAQLLDGGSTEDGLPFLVMELIEGRPIDEHCEQEGLSIEERIELFRTVCSAVALAHQNLVVHRDLKPSNVLVTADGAPKLLDFGIAKLLNPELASATLAPTATALRMMTPEYASPEQVRGEPISTASDIYSLGVLLYRLLTGHPPYRAKSGSPVEMMRLVCEQEPPRPSTSVPGARRRLRRRLAGDLDNIVLMALRKQPRRRYGSVEQLSEDLRRYLDGRPVSARKVTVLYRWGKFVRRNRWAVAASAAFVLACLGFAVALGLQRLAVARERDRVTEERNRAERVTEFLVDLFEVADPQQAMGETLTARQILKMGSRKLTVELQDQPLLQARLMDAVGMIHVRLGLLDEARPLLESALATRRRLPGEPSKVAESLSHLAELERWEHDYEAAVALDREALEMRRRLLGVEHPEVAESLQSLALSLVGRGDYGEAESLLRKALAMRRELFGDQHPKVAESLSNLGGFLYHSKGDFAAAEPVLRKALAMRRELLGDQHLEVAETLNFLAAVLFYRSRYEEAGSLYREVLAIRRQILGDEHPLVAQSLNNLANNLGLLGETEEAERLYLQALEMARKLWGEHPVTAFYLGNLGISRYEAGDYTEAERFLRESLAMRRRLGEMPPEAGINQTWLAEVLIEKGEYEAACSQIEEAIENLGRGYPREHFWILHAESVRAACLIGRERYDEAERLLLDSYPKLRETMTDNDPLTRRALRRLIDLYEAWGRPEKAAEYRALAGQRL